MDAFETLRNFAGGSEWFKIHIQNPADSCSVLFKNARLNFNGKAELFTVFGRFAFWKPLFKKSLKGVLKETENSIFLEYEGKLTIEIERIS